VSNDTVSIHIDAPPETVFSYLLDPEHHLPGATNMRFAEGESIGAGTPFTYVDRMFGRTYEGAGVVKEYVPSQRLVFEFTDPSGSGTAVWTLAPAEGGTTLVVDSIFELRIPLVGPLLKRFVMLGFRVRTLPAMKKAVEKHVLAA
jgi:uncharacterized protein YndB with AHSA1/START domain